MPSQKPSQEYKPTGKKLEDACLQLEFCMRQTLAFYLWQTHFKPDGEMRDECQIVETATFVSVLLNIRMIDEFFDSKPFKTDIKAIHYQSFKNPGNFLSAKERQTLNELIFHLTYKKIGAFGTRINTYKLIIRAYKHFKNFMTFMHDDFFVGQRDVQGLLWPDKEWFESLVAEMAKLEN